MKLLRNLFFVLTLLVPTFASAQTPIGQPTDPPWSGSGPGSLIAILKAIYAGAIPAGTNSIGQVTANAGTNLNTSSLALESGGNLAAILAKIVAAPALDATVATTNTDIGPPGATACSTDTASCSLNALEQRIAQRISTLITTMGSPFQAGAGIANLPTTVDTNSGNAGASTLRVVPATNTPAIANWGHVATGAAPPADAVYQGAQTGGATGGLVQAPITCNAHVFKHITTATDTLAVQGVTSQTIYICGWRSRAAGVATWFLENTASTNANCSSANTQINGVATEAANTGENLLAAFWTGLKNTSGNGLCINSTGTGGVDVDIWYAQF